MITRADLRSMLRRRLEDTVAPYLWDDATLNDLLATAMAEFGSRFPAEGTLLVAVSEGDTIVPLTTLPTGAQPFRVRDPGGWEVRPSWGGSTGITADTDQGWRFWNRKLWFDRPARGGAWELDYLMARSLPTDDVAAAPVEPGDVDIVILLATASALLRRSVEQGKRGLERAGLALARVGDHHAQTAHRMMSARQRRARGSWFGPE